MIRALSPEKTVQFKGEIEKEVAFRLDQPLVSVESPALIYHCLKKRTPSMPSFSEGYAAAHTSGRFSV